MLLMQSLVRLHQVPAGFDSEQVLTLRLSPPITRYETNDELIRYYEDKSADYFRASFADNPDYGEAKAGLERVTKKAEA